MEKYVHEQPSGYHQEMQEVGQGYTQSNVAFGLQFLAPFTTLSFSQEASIGQSMLFVVPRTDYDCSAILFCQLSSVTRLLRGFKYSTNPIS
jgi:hypothetical protein